VKVDGTTQDEGRRRLWWGHGWPFEGEMQPHGPYGGPCAGGKKSIMQKSS
jgi:hypothetical protein